MALDVRLGMRLAKMQHANGKSPEETHKLFQQMWNDQIAADQNTVSDDSSPATDETPDGADRSAAS